MTDSTAQRLERLAGVLAAVGGQEPIVGLCRASVPVLSVSGVSLMMVVGRMPEPLGWSDAIAARLEDAQTTLGEGPCLEAHETGRAVVVPHMEREREPGWPAFGRAAREMGIGAVFSFPLRIGAARLGALTAYRSRPGPLSDVEHADALVIADIAGAAILTREQESEDGALGPDVEGLAVRGAVVHQASGMVSVQLGIDIADALVRLRAFAFASGRPLADVAADVVARRLRIDQV